MVCNGKYMNNSIKIDDKLENHFAKAKIMDYKKGEVIIRSDDEPAGVFLIKDGFVRSYSLTEDGRELTVNIFKPGAFFPLTWAIADIPNTYFYEAMTTLKVSKVPKEEIIKLVKKDNELLYDVTRRLLVGMNGLVVRMEYLFMGSAYNKVASAILLLARRFGEEDGDGSTVIRIHFTHQDVASLAGITRETATLEIQNLEKNGVIARENHTFIIKDIDRLREESYLTTEEGEILPYTY
jgi:CRP-like cAMP-binding protein